VLLTAKAETVPEPELLTKANAVVCPGAPGGFPIMPLQPPSMINPEIINAESRRSRA
jgi:hypothetical protein